MLYGPDGEIPAGLQEPELRSEVEKIGRERGWQVQLKSNILDGFGHAILRAGKGDRQRALWVRYGRTLQHIHWDMLTMGFEALQRKMLPELGYPQGWTHASYWETNWGTHYGTHITGVSSSSFPRGTLTLFADSSPAKIAVAESIISGEEGIRARRSRTIVLVDISASDCYAVSLERVLGGAEHYHSFHGPDGDATAFGVELKPRDGTVLGEDVPYGDISSLKDAELSCLSFMDEPQTYYVKGGRPASAGTYGVWGLDYALRGQDDVHLRMTMMPIDDAELTVAKGRAPGGKAEYEMTWAILRSAGKEPLGRQYLYVLEPYEKQRLVRKIEPVALSYDCEGQFAPLAMRVTTAEYVDTIVLQSSPGIPCQTEDGLMCDGEFGFWRTHKGKPTAAVLVRGTTLRNGDIAITQSEPAYEGTIESCDYEAFEFKVTPEPRDVSELAGKHLRIHNESGNDASYIIESARRIEVGCLLTVAFDPKIGEGFVGSFEDGYLVSSTNLGMARFSYYAGKTLTNEDQTVFYRLREVESGKRCRIDEMSHGNITAEKLSSEFTDQDGDGLTRFLIYDYGPGDAVTINRPATLPEDI